MIEIITSMIKTKFGFFQVQIGSMFGHTIELSQTSFSETPERLDTINMPLTTICRSPLANSLSPW